MVTFSYTLYDLTLCEAPLSSATVPQRIQESQHLVEAWICLRNKGHRLVQRLERDAAMLTSRDV